MPSSDSPSSALLTANAHLLALRSAHQRLVGHSAHESGRNAGKIALISSGAVVKDFLPSPLPAHLGWGSATVSAHLRQAEVYRRDKRAAVDAPAWGKSNNASRSHSLETNQHTPTSTKTKPRSSLIKVYPAIGLGMLRQEQAAPGRIWLLLRHSDVLGRGWISVAEARATLTGKGSPWRVCGWRQMRNLLKQGQGIFWRRDKERIWLRSAAKVAFALGVTQLTGRPVGVPAAALVGGIGKVRAHLYASFHSGRVKKGQWGVQAAPIARDTLTAVSGVGRASQRTYEKCTHTKVSHNFAVGEAVEEVNWERRAWRQGQALFELKDYRGEQGRKGKSYLAWQLPNTYVGQHQQRPLGRQKRINRELRDLVMKGMPGTAENAGEALTLSETALAKRYYSNGKLAAQTHGRDPERELYWKRHRTGNGRFNLWQNIANV